MIDRMELLAVIVLGFLLDQVLGDPHWLYHPVRLIGTYISFLEKGIRKIFGDGERALLAGGVVLVLFVTGTTAVVSGGILYACGRISPGLKFLVSVILCYQLFAVRSLKDESMKVYDRLKNGTIEEARYAVSMIVGRDTDRLDDAAVIRAAVETVAENTSDGVVAPLLFLAIGGAPLGFFYKAVNTMDSMLGYVEPPYKNIGLVPAKADDVVNYIPARLSALLMLAAGGLMGLDTAAGWRIFRRDRRKHASPNSAQTESVCAGLLGVRLAGDAWYHGVLHKKEYIGDAAREITHEDIPRVCRLMTVTAILTLLLSCGVKLPFAL